MRLPIPHGYSIEIEEHCFNFVIFRGDRPILRHISGDAVSSFAVEGDQMIVCNGDAQMVIILDAGLVTVRWSSEHAVSVFTLDGNWYGQGEVVNQLWPLNRIMLHDTPFTTSDNGETGLSPILSPIWLSSQGAAIRVHTPLSVSLNAPPKSYPRHEWSLGADQGPFDQRPFADPGGVGDRLLRLSGRDLHYEIVLGDNIVEAHRALMRRIGHLNHTPPLDVIAKPIWNTWARYHAEINQELVLTYAHEIVDHGYPRGRFVIDDRWQVQYGDLAFDSHRFPNPRKMIETMHGLGFEVQAWVVPFFAPESDAFKEGARQGYLVKDTDGNPLWLPWWQGVGCLLDVTNPAALNWFRENLRQLQASTGLDGFKFDAGEITYLPANAVTHQPAPANEFTHRYIEFVGEHFAWSDVRSGWLNHCDPVLPRQWDKASTWGLDNGLHSVITGGLSLSLIGYPLFLPDMIGGNAYTEQPDAELMIRWAQVNALLPGLQFSLAPWDYGEECDRLCRKAAEMHEAYAPLLLKWAEHHLQTGEPIIRPLWWIAPDDPMAQASSDQFLIGDDLLVAPVIHAGQRMRDVYLPTGRWQSEEGIFEGAVVLRDYPAPLDKLPLFRAVDKAGV